MESEILTSAGFIAFIIVTALGALIKAWINSAITSAAKAREKEQHTLELLERDLQSLKDRVLKVETKMVDETQTRQIINEAVDSLKKDIHNVSSQMSELMQAIINSKS